MKDFFGTELAIGDEIGFNPPKYKGLTKGIVMGFTPKMISIEYVHQGNIYSTKAPACFVAKAPCATGPLVGKRW